MNATRPMLRFVLLAFASLTLTASGFAQWDTSAPPPPHEKQAPAVENRLEIFDTMAEHISIRRDIRRRAQKANDLQAELLAAKDEAKLLGLYPTDEQTGLHDTPIATVVTIFGHSAGEGEADHGRPPRLSN